MVSVRIIAGSWELGVVLLRGWLVVKGVVTLKRLHTIGKPLYLKMENRKIL